MNTSANGNGRSRLAVLLAAILLVVFSPSIAAAHVGVGPAGGLVSGLAHPLGGLDHLCAMIGVGLWAAQRGGRAMWLVPLAFLGVMAIGGLIGMMGLAIPMVESGIVASVLILGCLVAAAVRLPLLATAGLVGLFALLHGHAHGLEAARGCGRLALRRRLSDFKRALGGLGHRAGMAGLPTSRHGLADSLCRRRHRPVRRLSLAAAIAGCWARVATKHGS